MIRKLKKFIFEINLLFRWNDMVDREIDDWHPGELWLDCPEVIPPKKYMEAGKRYDFMREAREDNRIRPKIRWHRSRREWQAIGIVYDVDGSEKYSLGIVYEL
jgi:hypothetical protein